MHEMSAVSRIITRAAAAALLAAGPGLAAQSPADPGGIWRTEDNRARIRIEPCGSRPGQVCGYLVWMEDGLDPKGRPLRDLRNPDPARRSQALLGEQLLAGAVRPSDGRIAGRIYDAESGKSYDVTLWRDADSLKVEGCVLAIFCATQTWSRVKDALPGQLVGATGAANGPRPEQVRARPPVPGQK
ncbi:DUF2147 domain-containing protein [Labrys wisconsinensis]|uniref:Uncharacterized protein (DUF2147 family) n=1 Tax=Labrys wisconsinensis TaxID=425677 RepID=A0ABU0J4C6_9HYPH|nr:DUF2147 domain-containing protein [Labrys wisconsinensis]MDQ0468032.1 uncharacterized protein (DUF2147 family) [Labrys wisconsinensis]